MCKPIQPKQLHSAATFNRRIQVTCGVSAGSNRDGLCHYLNGHTNGVMSTVVIHMSRFSGTPILR